MPLYIGLMSGTSVDSVDAVLTRIVDGSIECPRHGARFDIRTGEVTAPPAYEPVDTFPVQVVDGLVQVRDDRWD